LLERAKARDPDAWDRLVNLYSPLVYKWGRAKGLGKYDAAEVGLDVFAKVLKNLGGFHHDQPGDSFRGWLKTITHHAIQDHLRRTRDPVAAKGGGDSQRFLEQLPADDSDEAAAPAEGEGAEVDERTLVVRQALKQLEPEFKPSTWQAF
jgi:RNA polymerase sigma-70 factor (ECF subfamily)